MRAIPRVLFAAAIGSALAAQTHLIPTTATATTPGSTFTGFPWDRDLSSANGPAANDMRVQYFYDAAEFAAVGGPILITGLRFRADDFATTTTWTGGTYYNVQVSIGHAAIDHAAVSTATSFDANYLGGHTPPPAYSGPVFQAGGSGSGVGTPGAFYTTITLTTPVYYNPAKGDLLLDLKHDGEWDNAVGGGPGGALRSEADAVGAVNRVYNINDANAALPSAGDDGNAIVCELGYTTLPGLVAGFTTDKPDVSVGEVVKFIDLSYTNDAGGITQHAWDFDNDGIWDSTNPSPTWTYFVCGPQTVRLRVRDASNPQSIVTQTSVTVGGAESSFTATPIQGDPPLAVQFTDTSSANDFAGLLAWDWDLDGSGSTDSTEQNPMAAYATRGLFNARLRAADVCGTRTEAVVPIDTRTQVCSLFTGGLTTGHGAAVYFDVAVTNPSGITVTEIKSNFVNAVGKPGVGVEVWVRGGSRVGFEQTPIGWTLASSGIATAAGVNAPTVIDVVDFCLPGNATYGIALVAISARYHYTTGNGANQVYSNADLTMTFGAANNTPFSSALSSPRVWNGCFVYEVGVTNAGSVVSIGAGCPGSSGSTPAIGGVAGQAPAIGRVFAIELSNAPISQPLAFVLVGLVNLGGVPLGLIGMPGCSLFADPLISLPAPTDGSGIGLAALEVPYSPPLVSGTFYTQGFAADAAANAFGAIVSNGAANVIGCN